MENEGKFILDLKQTYKTASLFEVLFGASKSFGPLGPFYSFLILKT